MFDRIRADIETALDRDPAARSKLEVLVCYSGLHAVLLHRVAHWLWERELRLMARFVSQMNRLVTGIEVHPAARIGAGFFVDHGMGVVIGETSDIGENVTLYQGVTLGGTGKETGKRHPTLGDNVVVGVGVSILGAIEVGDNSVVGAGSVVLRDVCRETQRWWGCLLGWCGGRGSGWRRLRSQGRRRTIRASSARRCSGGRWGGWSGGWRSWSRGSRRGRRRGRSTRAGEGRGPRAGEGAVGGERRGVGARNRQR